MARPVVNLKGKRFGRLVVIDRAGSIEYAGGNKVAGWKVHCDCGAEKVVAGASLSQGKTSSCGCSRRRKRRPAENIPGNKRCCTCQEIKEIKSFYRLKSSPDGRYPNCIQCYRKARKPKTAQIRATRKKWHRKLRLEVLQHYGGACDCCGEAHMEFLAIDHIDGGGSQHRKKIRADITWWLKKEGFPEGFRVLCHNCNQALGRYGYCPHTAQGHS